MVSQEEQQSNDNKQQFYYGYIVVIAAFVIMMAQYCIRSAFGIFFKPMIAEFGWSRAITSGAFSLSMVIEGLLAIVMGSLTDRIGPRIVMTLCGFLLGLGCLLMSQISAIWQIYLFYGVIMGIGAGGTFVSLLTTVARWFVRRRSMMTGVVLAGSGIGTLATPPVANWLIYTYDWRIAFIIIGSVVLVATVLSAQFLKRDPSRIGLLPDGDHTEDGHSYKLAAAGLSFREAVSTNQFWLFFAMLFCLGACLFSIMVHVAPHVIDLGISATSAANVLATVGGLTILGRVLLGTVGDQIGNRKVIMLGFALMSVALFWLVQTTNIWMLFLLAGVFGFAEGGTGAVVVPGVAEIFGLRSIGLIFGVVSCGLTVGAAIGPLLSGHIFDLTSSYNIAFLGLAALGMVGLILSIFIKPIRDDCSKDKFQE